MLRKELSVFRPVADRVEILDCLESYWNEASKEDGRLQGPADQRAARRIWAGVGCLAFGRPEHLEDTLLTMMRFSGVAGYVACRYYTPGIQRLLPLPDDLSPVENPRAVLSWFRQNRDAIRWDEEAGMFVRDESGGKTGRQGAQVGTSILVPKQARRSALVVSVRAIRCHWRRAVFEDRATHMRYDDFWEAPLDQLKEILVYRDPGAADAAVGKVVIPGPHDNTVIRITVGEDHALLAADDPNDATFKAIVETVSSGLRNEIFNAYAEPEAA
jgi:hypothetical protein